MAIKLPHIIELYVDSSNQHEAQSILSGCSDDAVVRDEGKTLQGKKAIEDWITTIIERYKFQFKPLSIKHEAAEIVDGEVSGTFDGSETRLCHSQFINSEPLKTRNGYF